MSKSFKKNILEFQSKRHTSRLSRTLLEFIEDIIAEQEQSINRALDNIPEEYHNYVIQSNVLNDEKMERIRKRILDHCGNFSRDIVYEIDNILKE